MSEDAFDAFMGERFGEIQKLIMTKRAAYGTKNLTEQGILGVLNRMGSDKMSRAIRIAERAKLRQDMRGLGMPAELVDEHAPPINTGDERLEDTLSDIIGYSIICLAMMDGQWEEGQ